MHFPGTKFTNSRLKLWGSSSLSDFDFFLFLTCWANRAAIKSLVKDSSLYKQKDHPEGLTLNTGYGLFFGHCDLFSVFRRVREISLFSIRKRRQRGDLIAVYSHLMQRCGGGRAGLFLEMHRGQAETQWTKVERRDSPVRYKSCF